MESQSKIDQWKHQRYRFKFNALTNELSHRTRGGLPATGHAVRDAVSVVLAIVGAAGEGSRNHTDKEAYAGDLAEVSAMLSLAAAKAYGEVAGARPSDEMVPLPTAA